MSRKLQNILTIIIAMVIVSSSAFLVPYIIKNYQTGENLKSVDGFASIVDMTPTNATALVSVSYNQNIVSKQGTSYRYQITMDNEYGQWDEMIDIPALLPWVESDTGTLTETNLYGYIFTLKDDITEEVFCDYYLEIPMMNTTYPQNVTLDEWEAIAITNAHKWYMAQSSTIAPIGAPIGALVIIWVMGGLVIWAFRQD